MPLTHITSATNKLIKAVVRLHNAQERKNTRRCIVEGKRALSTILSKLDLETLFCTKQLVPVAQSLAPNSKIIIVSDSIMKKISTSSTPSGLLGILKIPDIPSPDLLGPGLVLAQISNPGNMGTLIRTAVACNVSSVVIVEGCDPWSPKVLQATVGTSAHTTLFQWSWDQLITYKKNLKLAALIIEEGQPPNILDASQTLIVVGNEARGIPLEWVTQCDVKVTLPMPGKTESLNAAVAGSIALYLTFVHAKIGRPF